MTTNEDTATTWNYTVSDVETAVSCSGSVSVTSSNTALLPVANITKSGTAPTCTLSLTPVANQNGTSTVTVSVTDGNGAIVKDQFVFTVTPDNDSPVISNITDQTTAEEWSPTELRRRS